MRCPACYAINPRGNNYCGSCGVPLTAACRHCGHMNQLTAQFCGACGEALDPVPNEQAIESAAARPAWGELKQGTVLFADVVGSTQLIADLDPEQAMERLRPSLEIMVAAVNRFGGTVIRTLGDGIMAVFGLPLAQEAHALLACQAAIAIQRAAGLDNRNIKVRIGLHSGELVISQDGDRPETIAHGATIHLANRLEQMAEPGAICLTGDCYRQVKLHCDVRFLGRRIAKGFTKPIETYVLLGFRPAVASQQFRAVNLTPFHNRTDEFQRLQQALHRAESGDARVVGISGAAGTGKSRLCYEFAEWCRHRFIPVLEARALVSSQATPLQPILEFLRLFLGVDPADDDAAVRHQISQHPAAAGLDPETELPLLYQFLGLIPPGTEIPSRGPGTRNSRLRELVGRMVGHRATEPVVILFEDLHWLDAGSADFVGEIVRAVAGTKAMLLLNFRQSYTADWMEEPCYEQIPLGELDATHTSDLVEKLVGDRPELQSVNARIVARCGGNPFFAEELVRSFSERGVIRGVVGNYQLGPTSDEDLLPASVQAIIGARIDGLVPQEKTILHIAAIIGKEFPLSVIEDVAGIGRAQLETVFDRLHQARFVEPRFGSGEQVYFFRHPLIQEVAYNEQLRSRRSELHAAAAAALERHYSPKLDEFAALIAYHYEAAGDHIKAATYAARAAVWIGSTASTQALQHWHDVRRLLQDQPHSVDTDTLRMRASGQIAAFGWRAGMTAEETKPFLDEAVGWARKIDNTMLSLLLAADGRILVASGHPADAYVARIREAIAIESKQARTGRMATLNVLLCHACFLAGFLDEALEANGRALQGIDSIDAFDQEFCGLNVEQWMKSLRARVLVRLGRFDDAEHCLQELLAIEETLLDPAVRFIPHLVQVDLGYFRDDPAIATEHARRIGEIAERGQSPYLQVYALGCAGTARFVEKDFAEGVAKLTEGVGCAQSTGAALEFEPEMMATLADCHHRAGDADRALSVAQQAIDLAQRRGARLAECRASMIYASALFAAGGDARKAEALLRLERAEKLIDVTGASVFVAPLARLRALIADSRHPLAAQEA